MPSDYEELEERMRVERQKFDILSDSMSSMKDRLEALWIRLEGDAA